MSNVISKNSAKDWARLAFKLGLVFTDPKIRAAAADEVKGRVGKVTQTASRRYEDAMDRLEAAGDALQGRNSGWGSRLTGFLLGVGVGAGLGMLLAPASGTETREALRERAVEMKNRVVDSASTAVSDARHSVTSMPSTGTQG